MFTLGYSRQDGTLDSNLTGQLREVNYSESPDDRRIRSLNASFNYPVTALVTSGLYARYSHTEYIDTLRTDNNFSTGANVRYQLSRSIGSSFDLRYRNRDSTDPIENFTEWSAFVTLVYGFGQPMRPTRAGGF